MTAREEDIELSLISEMEKIMLAVAKDETLSEQERTLRLRRGRIYINGRGRSDLVQAAEKETLE